MGIGVGSGPLEMLRGLLRLILVQQRLSRVEVRAWRRGRRLTLMDLRVVRL